MGMAEIAGGQRRVLHWGTGEVAVTLVALIWILLAAFWAAPASFTEDGFIYQAMLDAFARNGSLFLDNGYEEYGSEALALNYVQIAEGRLAPQYPGGWAILGAPAWLLGGVRGIILLNAVAGALTLVMIWIAAEALFRDRTIAVTAALVYGLASFAVEYAVINGETTQPVDLRESRVLGPVECYNCRFENVVRFDGSVFESRAVFEDGTFAASASFTDAEFRGPVAFNLTTFRRWADVKDATFHEEACFRGASFEKGLFGVGVTFGGAADFMNARFDSVANFYDATFERGGLFSSATFRADAKFTACAFDAAVAVGTNFVDDPSLDDSELPYRDGVIPETCLALSSARCAGSRRPLSSRPRCGWKARRRCSCRPPCRSRRSCPTTPCSTRSTS